MVDRALLIGINQYANVTPLRGCVNDVNNVAKLLKRLGGLPDANITQLTDAAATRANILAALQALVASASAGDRIFVHFSGHGAQLPSSDPNEPDGADEVLCPHDYDWTQGTALSDDVLSAALAKIAGGVKATMTVDACHSGDMSRNVLLSSSTPRRARTPTPPAGVAQRLRAPGRIRRLALRDASGAVAFVSACRPWEVAIDTVFDGMNEGAFTHEFCDAVDGAPDKVLDEVVEAIRAPLSSFGMTPGVEGPLSMREKPYCAAVSKASSVTPLSVTPRRIETVWERAWRTNVLGHSGETAVAVLVSGPEVVAHVKTNLFGGGEWEIVLDGQGAWDLDIGLSFGLRLVVESWSFRGDLLQFHLTAALMSPFLSPIPVGTAPVAVNLRGARGLSYVPQSAADLVAAVNLRSASGSLSEESPGSPLIATGGSRAPGDIVPMAFGTEGWGPNWREDRVVVPRDRVRTARRVNVVFDPVRGGGWVGFVRWANDDERDPSFIMHIGNGFFGGWGSVRYQVQGVYEVDNPFPRGEFAARTTSEVYRSSARPGSVEPRRREPRLPARADHHNGKHVEVDARTEEQ